MKNVFLPAPSLNINFNIENQTESEEGVHFRLNIGNNQLECNLLLIVNNRYFTKAQSQG